MPVLSFELICPAFESMLYSHLQFDSPGLAPSAGAQRSLHQLETRQLDPRCRSFSAGLAIVHPPVPSPARKQKRRERFAAIQGACRLRSSRSQSPIPSSSLPQWDGRFPALAKTISGKDSLRRAASQRTTGSSLPGYERVVDRQNSSRIKSSGARFDFRRGKDYGQTQVSSCFAHRSLIYRALIGAGWIEQDVDP